MPNNIELKEATCAEQNVNNTSQQYARQTITGNIKIIIKANDEESFSIIPYFVCQKNNNIH